jgi:hypothetical protein
MSDSNRDLSDAIAALAKSQLLTVDVLRQTQATTQHIASTLGRICDQQQEILTRMDRMAGDQRESQRNLRVVKDQMTDVIKRLEPLEAHHRSVTKSGLATR